jgi:hypothetical protein
MKRTATVSGRTTTKTMTRSATKSVPSSWHVPRGKDVTAVTKKATGQVIRHYGETLKKLKDR